MCLAIYRISESVHAVCDGLLSHPRDCAAYLVLGDAPVLVDCGSGEGHAALLRNLKKLGVQPRDIAGVLGTHCHYDHLAGITALRRHHPDLCLALHDADAPAVEDADQALTCSGWMFGRTPPPERVDDTFTGGELFDIAGLSFQVIHAPGHTPGSVCYRVEIDGAVVVFAGDSLTPSCGRVHGVRRDWERTFDRLAALEYDVFLPGHASQISNPYYAALMMPGPAPARRAAVRALRRARVPFWHIASFQYRYLITPFARLADSARH